MKEPRFWSRVVVWNILFLALYPCEGISAVYKIRENINLNGDTVRIPAGCVIDFKGGKLTNGTLVLENTVFKGDYCGNVDVTLLGSNKTHDYKVVDYGDMFKTQSHISTAKNGLVILGTVNIYGDIPCFTSIRGESGRYGEPILIGGLDTRKDKTRKNSHYVLNVKEPNVTISGLTIKKVFLEPESYVYHRMALEIEAGNVSITDCMIDGAIDIVNRRHLRNLKNVTVAYCTIKADFSILCQDEIEKENTYSEKDVISVRNGFKDVSIHHNVIDAINVNRVFKFSSATLNNDYTTITNLTENIRVYDNYITASSNHGKQFCDMFCGSNNIIFENNKIICYGFLDLFENKSARITGKQRFCVINNEIKCNCQLGYLNLQGESVFEYLDNNITVDKNPRTNGFYLIDAYSKFRFVGNHVKVINVTDDNLSVIQDHSIKNGDYDITEISNNVFLGKVNIQLRNLCRQYRVENNECTSSVDTYFVNAPLTNRADNSYGVSAYYIKNNKLNNIGTVFMNYGKQGCVFNALYIDEDSAKKLFSKEDKQAFIRSIFIK